MGKETEQSEGRRWGSSTQASGSWPTARKAMGRKPVSAFAHPQRLDRVHPPGGTGKEKAEGERGSREVAQQALGKGKESILSHLDSPSGNSVSALKSSL